MLLPDTKEARRVKLEGGFHEGLATSAYFRRATIAQELTPHDATLNTGEGAIALSDGSAAVSSPGRLIGGGAVGS